MKKLLLLLAGLSLLAACENNKKKDMSFEMQTLTVRENLETVAKDLASNRDWLTQEVTNDLGKYKSVKLGVVKPDARLNKVGFHGETFELAVVSYYRTQGMISGLQKSAWIPMNFMFRKTLMRNVNQEPLLPTQFPPLGTSKARRLPFK
jgi:hypothetical protein